MNIVPAAPRRSSSWPRGADDTSSYIRSGRTFRPASSASITAAFPLMTSPSWREISSTAPASPATSRMPSRIISGGGAAKTSPTTFASSTPFPTNPMAIGSCPEPFPIRSAVLRSAGAGTARRTTRGCAPRATRPGYAATKPSIMSSTIRSCALISFFIGPPSKTLRTRRESPPRISRRRPEVTRRRRSRRSEPGRAVPSCPAVAAAPVRERHRPRPARPRRPRRRRRPPRRESAHPASSCRRCFAMPSFETCRGRARQRRGQILRSPARTDSIAADERREQSAGSAAGGVPERLRRRARAPRWRPPPAPCAWPCRGRRPRWLASNAFSGCSRSRKCCAREVKKNAALIQTCRA